LVKPVPGIRVEYREFSDREMTVDTKVERGVGCAVGVEEEVGELERE
jgi:hypothetical protein